MDQNDIVSLLFAVAVVAGALALRPRVGNDGSRAVGWWIGLLHGLFAVLTVHAATMAHDLAFRCAMITFAVYAFGMTASETLALIKTGETT